MLFAVIESILRVEFDEKSVVSHLPVIAVHYRKERLPIRCQMNTGKCYR